MALLRVGGINPGKRREELLSNYDGEEPYMPGGYDTPYDGEEPYMPEGYDAPYDDDGYEAAPYDDYDSDYGDDDPYYGPGGRYDDDYGYDEAYGYDEDGYPLEDREYGRPPYYDEPQYDDREYYPDSDFLRFADQNEWLTFILLLLFPPLGIWLLWRRRRYTQSVSILLTLLSILWVVALLVLLIVRPFRPKTDTTITPQPVGAAAVATATPEPTPEPQPTIIPVEEVDEANAVYTVAGAPYYHQGEGCTAIPSGVEVDRVSRASAIEGSLLACPYCMAGQYSDGMWDLVFVNAQTEDKSNVRVYCSAYNVHFHTDPTCSDIGGDAHEVGLKEALLMARTACDVCCISMGQEMYCTVDGTYYHAKEDCSGMRNASYVTVAEARVTGKKRCPTCIGGTDEIEEKASETKASGYYVYATPNGTYYHVNATCSGMKDAKQILLSDMLSQKRPACPVCCPDAETTVYAENGNPYYHSYSACSGMTKATQGILVNALAAGLTRCPVCWTSDDTA